MSGDTAVNEVKTTTVVDEIAAERQRQITVEGWTPEHDDTHSKGQMARAAACYALSRPIVEAAAINSLRGPATKSLWPWDWKWWKPTDRRRDLIKAAALIVAEIERLDRAAIASAESSS